MPAELAKSLAARYIEMWNSGDVSVADAVLRPDWVDHAHPEVESIEDVKAAVGRTRAAFPDFHISIESMVGEEDQVAVQAVLRGMRPPSDPDSRVLWLIRVTAGKMAEQRTFQESIPGTPSRRPR
jgi:hypothetical protein